MKTTCDRCTKQLADDGVAHICSWECTFCPACSEDLRRRCPNCGGELVPRLRRKQAD